MKNGYKNKCKIRFIDKNGKRKYLNQSERNKFYKSAMSFEEPIRSFGLNLYFTGTRISETLATFSSYFDFDLGAVLVRSLKKRDDYDERLIYLPTNYLRVIKRYIKSKGNSTDTNQLWEFTRQTGDRYVKKIMTHANLTEVQKSAITLRHSFAINALQSGVPITAVKEFMGHNSIETTYIYTKFGSLEQKMYAQKMWE